MKFPILIFISFIGSALFAKHLGKSGESFPVEEKNLSESLKSKAALHPLDTQKFSKEVSEYIQNPTSIDGIGKAIEKRSHAYDPTYTLEEDIEINGQRLAEKGMKINPLNHMELPGGLLFFDGSDPAQIAWARRFSTDYKWVLVKGSPLSLENQEKRPVYFDQFGLFTIRFQIQNVPAKVAQAGTVLLVEEIPVDDEGNARS